MNAIARQGRRLLRSNARVMQVTRFVALALVSPRILVLRPSRRVVGNPGRCRHGVRARRPRCRGRDRIRAWWLPQRDASVAVIVFPGRAVSISYELSTFDVPRRAWRQRARGGLSRASANRPVRRAKRTATLPRARRGDCVQRKRASRARDPRRPLAWRRGWGVAGGARELARCGVPRRVQLDAGFRACYMPRWLVRARCSSRSTPRRRSRRAAVRSSCCTRATTGSCRSLWGAASSRARLARRR